MFNGIKLLILNAVIVHDNKFKKLIIYEISKTFFKRELVSSFSSKFPFTYQSFNSLKFYLLKKSESRKSKPARSTEGIKDGN